MLMRVSGDQRLANRDHGNVLPNSWRTLYELTKLDDDAFNVAALTLAELLGRPSAQDFDLNGDTEHRIQRSEDRRSVFVDGDPLEVVSDGYRAVMAIGCDIQLRDPVLTIAEVSGLLKVDDQAVRYLHRMRRLRGHRVGRELRWRLSAVERFVEKHLGGRLR